MQFPVPQFIDMEDKIIGPFSLKQFGFIFVGGLIVLGIFRAFGFGAVFILFGIPIALLTLFISFGSFNGKKVYAALPIFLGFLSAPKVMVFEKKSNTDNLNIGPITIEQIEAIRAEQQPKAAAETEPVQSQLKRLSRLLDQKNEEETEILNEKR